MSLATGSYPDAAGPEYLDRRRVLRHAAFQKPEGRLPVGARQLDWLGVAGTEEAQLGALPRVVERFPSEQGAGSIF